MTRKPSAILDYKLRIRETLRRRLEQAAKRGVSINAEMASRLERSFEQESQRTIDMTAADIATSWGRFAGAFHELNKQGDLLRAVEALIEQLPAEVRERAAIKKAVADVQRVTTMIDLEAKILPRRMHTTGGDQAT